MIDVVHTIGARISELAKREGSARALSVKAGLNPSHVGVILVRLRRDPSANIEGKTLEAIARAGGVTVAWLLTGESSPGQGPAERAPARAAAAAAARSRGIWEEAIRSVLAEDVAEQDFDRSPTWWLSRMMMREEEMIDEALRRREHRGTAAPPQFFPKSADTERPAPDESGEARIVRKRKAANQK